MIAENDGGVTISGMKMLATGAVFADEVWIGNLTAIDDKRQERKHHLRIADQHARRLVLGARAL